MNQIAILPRLLGSLMYLPVEHETNQAILSQLSAIQDCFPWESTDDVAQLIAKLEATKADLDEYAYSVLFEGQGEMVAPPWGSVYQDKENIVMGDSTGDFDLFLTRYGIELTSKVEPNDQYGLMLWAMAALLEDGQEEAVVILLEQHLLTWAYRYLELLAGNQTSEFYATLAQLNTLFLQHLEHHMELTPKQVQLYK
ncbi:hypothetical protein F9817_17675 [Vibrio sp. CAIM 722]|uniref:Uncharacterized protein n=1 Tax=Vibrio eleionomae TaxID=2653505 RepID=A0A7X4LN25_9VIBR|nr:molecular chaperone [Vibrio eleionomae]MZI95010.1 hypothetical protein [Vibrio eleionomae]